jgi:hypothetical protein
MRFILVLSIGLAVSGCGKDSNGRGSGDLDLDIGPGEVRAGRLSQDQLPADPNGLAVWEAGDFAVVNEHIAVIIEDDEDSDLYMPCPTDGKVDLSVPAGNHRVVVSRGYEYDIFRDDDDPPVQVIAGQQTSVDAKLTRVVDSIDVMCGDFHIHTHRSPDAPDARGFYDPTIRNRDEQTQTLDPVHPGRLPFGVTNPIFFAP